MGLVNHNHESDYDEMCPSLQEYFNKMEDPKCQKYGFHNVYHIETFDKDGNKTGENFARNLFLNQGINIAYLTHFSSSASMSLGLGTGTREPAYTDTNLESRITYKTISISRTNYPLKYHPESGFCTVKKRLGSITLDYNISGWDTDKIITEVGIYRNDTSYLLTRALIDEPYIVKKPNEKLTVTVYYMVSFNPSLVNRLWNHGYYSFFSLYGDDFMSLKNYSESYHTYWGLGSLVPDSSSSEYYFSSSQYNYWRCILNSRIATYETNNGGSFNSETNVLTSSKLTTDYITIENNRQPIQFSFMYQYTNNKGVWFSKGFIVFHPEYLSEPEEITTDFAFTNKYGSSLLTKIMTLKPNSATREYRYGIYHLPIFNMDIKELKRYNHLTKEWDIEEEFVNPYWNDYSDYLQAGEGHGYMWCTLNGKSVRGYVFINVKADQKDPDGNPPCPITSITDDGKTVYTSDTYWDTTTWKLIEDIHNIPEDQQNARYYIYSPDPPRPSTGDDWTDYLASINRTYREQHRIVLPDNRIPNERLQPDSSGNYTIDSIKITSSNVRQTFSSNEYDWVVMFNYIYYLNTDEGIKRYTLRSAGNDGTYLSTNWSSYLINFGDKLLFTENGTNSTSSSYDNNAKYSRYAQGHARLYYVNERNQLSEPTYIDITLNWSSPPNRNSCENWWSHSSNGWAVVWRMRDSTETEAIVLNVNELDEDGYILQYTVDIENIWAAQAIDRTDYLFYKLRGDSEHRYFLYDMRTKESRYIFSIDPSYSTEGEHCWKDFIYVSAVKNGTYTTFCYDYISEVLIELPNFRVTQFQLNTIQRSKFRFLQNDDVMIICGEAVENNHYMYYVTKENFSNFVKIYPDNYNKTEYDSGFGYGSNYTSFESLSYMDDGKHMLLSFNYSASVAYGESYVIDLGWMIDNNTGHDVIPDRRADDYNENYNTSALIVPYHDGFLYKHGFYNGNKPIRWYPLEHFIRHRIRLTTTTIQAYNNPIRIGNKSWRIQLTNDFSKKNPLDE